MLFNSYVYFALFLPVTFSGYFFLNKLRLTFASSLWLVSCSLFFYSWWDINFLPLILFSICFNYLFGFFLSRREGSKKILLVIGISVNVMLLGYFKYSNFVIDNINTLLAHNIGHIKLVLPLAISFFTFQQIAYLVDSYRGDTKEYKFLNYALFVSFFPQLIAGPIVHHKEMMPQFHKLRNKVLDFKNMSAGIYIFMTGLFKKVVVADSLSPYVSQAFDKMHDVSFIDAWIASLSFTFQIYFDFSGYMDMAIGSALLLNIRLPINFNSPYKSLSVREFWQRWHITLGRFLKEHIYIPLGGDRNGVYVMCLSVMATFLIGGLWHGAAWTFVFWGALHGTAVMVNRLWQRQGIRINRFIAWFLTFNFLNFSWVFFRAGSWSDAIKMLKAMAGLNNFSFQSMLEDKIYIFEMFQLESTGTALEAVLLLLTLLLVVIASRNTHQLRSDFKAGKLTLAVSLVLGFVSFICMDWIGEFLYFNF